MTLVLALGKTLLIGALFLGVPALLIGVVVLPGLLPHPIAFSIWTLEAMLFVGTVVQGMNDPNYHC